MIIGQKPATAGLWEGRMSIYNGIAQSKGSRNRCILEKKKYIKIKTLSPDQNIVSTTHMS